MENILLHIARLSLQFRRKTILKDLSWDIAQKEHWLLSGKSGSGKTVLAKAIAGLIHAHGDIELTFNAQLNLPAKVMFVPQWSTFKDKQGSSNFYYQQRYNSQDAENSTTVWESLSQLAVKLKKDNSASEALLKSLDLWERKDAPLLQLSSGEHKKLQLIKALLVKPQLLILDNPYTGLDVLSRENLNSHLNEICLEGVQLILISNDGQEPTCINRYATLVDGKIETSAKRMELSEPDSIPKELPDFLQEPVPEIAAELIRLQQVSVTYGTKQVLKNINWTVKTGEKWQLKGHNGSGKSTLLSLLTGDNPQAYAQQVQIFGKQRGSGESIWDIKKNIGFISPELQWYFEPSSTVFQTIASGFFDTAGLFRTLNTFQSERVKDLLKLFKLEEEAQTLLTQLPIGQQRIALLARAIIKNPPLLILDEPCQGLDKTQTQLLNNLVDRLCTANRTLIYVGHFENQLPECIRQQLTLSKGQAIITSRILENELTTTP